MIGIIYKSTGSFYRVKDEAGHVWTCRVRGKMKIDDEISSTNPVAVGDKVAFDLDTDHEDAGIITGVLERENYVVRVSPHSRFQRHIIASNIDQAVLVATIRQPKTSNGFIDRFLVTAEAYHIPAIVVFNKTDLLNSRSLEELEQRLELYRSVGYMVFPVSTLNGEGFDDFQEQLSGKVTLLSGHSGVGKSTIINQLIPDKKLKVQAVSDWSGKGQHSTTFAEMMDLPISGSIIDTPGVKEFGIVDIDKDILSHYFPEMRSRLAGCRFNNCIHVNEPGCSIKTAVESGVIHVDRYVSYLAIMDSL